MTPAEKAPLFHVADFSYQDYERQVQLWAQMVKMDPSRGAVALVLKMSSTERQVRLAAAQNYMAKNDGADHIVNTLRIYFAPGRVDSIHQAVVRFLQFRRPGQTMGGYSATTQGGLQDANGCRIPRRFCFRPVREKRGASTPGDVAGIGQYSKEPGFPRCRDDHVKNISVLRRRGPPRYTGGGGCG